MTTKELIKITKLRQIEEKRRYDDACGLAHALDLLGERWAMLVLRELAYGPRRFSGLKRDLPGISANILTQRLTELEARGLVRKTKLPPPASVQVYEATDWGLEVVGSLIVHYPSYIVFVALFNRIDLFLHAYLLVNAAHVARSLLGITWKLGRSAT